MWCCQTMAIYGGTNRDPNECYHLFGKVCYLHKTTFSEVKGALERGPGKIESNKFWVSEGQKVSLVERIVS